MTFPFPLPDLRMEHVQSALLYANRVDALQSWPSGGRVAEVGVAYGAFSSQILRVIRPQLFDAYDLFRLHEFETLWGRPTTELFAGMTQRAYYESRFAEQISSGQVRLFEGDSSHEIAKRDPGFYDTIYIDGDHSYEGVRRDAAAAMGVLRPGGMLVFNDYVLYDKKGNFYGVVPVVHDLCVNQGWFVKYLALQKEMFCDIALVKQESSTG